MLRVLALLLSSWVIVTVSSTTCGEITPDEAAYDARELAAEHLALRQHVRNVQLAYYNRQLILGHNSDAPSNFTVSQVWYQGSAQRCNEVSVQSMAAWPLPSAENPNSCSDCAGTPEARFYRRYRSKSIQIAVAGWRGGETVSKTCADLATSSCHSAEAKAVFLRANGDISCHDHGTQLDWDWATLSYKAVELDLGCAMYWCN
eukprot:TRINITY_DN77765_c0_g1_i1.p1 TRINITY_DN77765_c0_g1~~TRINITY_DN77765_c0_g1_i1.p1  ORF type:complete len:203 (-),score=11.05 TRINITY_DN77765_c0_g1_i1:151-759(-)